MEHSFNAYFDNESVGIYRCKGCGEKVNCNVMHENTYTIDFKNLELHRIADYLELIAQNTQGGIKETEDYRNAAGADYNDGYLNAEGK